METVPMSPAELDEYLVDRLGADVIAASHHEFGTHTVTVTREHYVPLVTLLRDDPHLAFDFFDCSFGVDEKETGFSVVNVLYSTTKRHRLLVKIFCDGGRDNPTVPTLTGVFEGADWMERESWDMFGIEFEGHPGLAPRLLTVENFEGWPLRKDFHLASRVAKPWPGVKEPAETDEDGNVIESETRIGDAPGPMALDEVMAEQARRVNAIEVPEAPEDPEPAAESPSETPTESSTDDPLRAESEANETLPEGIQENAPGQSTPAEPVDPLRAESEANETLPEGIQGDAPGQSTPAEPSTVGDDTPADPSTGDDEAKATEPEAPRPSQAPPPMARPVVEPTEEGSQ